MKQQQSASSNYFVSPLP
uniref:Uncharacterized protein n=1 Tax=Anguilla anguilla TaxID=7936 RepID=A0A0E9TXW2_ANGAN